MKTMILGLVLAASASAMASSDMIQVDSHGIAKAPIYDAQGKQLDMVPVIIKKTGEKKREIIALRVPGTDRDAVQAYGSDLGVLATWSIDLTNAEDIGFTFGVIVGEIGCDGWDGPPSCMAKGVLLQAGRSLDKYSLSVGYAFAAGLGGGSDHAGVLVVPVFGAAIKATLLNTDEDANGWGDGGLFDPAGDAMYAGGEIDVTYMIIKMSVGLFKRIDEKQTLLGNDDQGDWLMNFGIGVGF